jgi:hypothetical protein
VSESQTPNAARVQSLNKAVKAAVAAQDFARALALLDELEPLLRDEPSATPAPPPPPTPAAPPAGGEALRDRLRAVTPLYQQAAREVPDRKPALDQLAAAAAAAAKARDHAGALALLDRLEAAARAALAAPPPAAGGAAADEPDDDLDADEAAPIDEAAFRRGWPAARQAWQDASDAVDGQLAKLQTALKASGDTELVEIAEYGLNGVTGNHKVPLMASVRELDSAAGPKLAGAVSRAARIVAAFRAHLDGAETVAACDDNPFGVPVTIRKSIGGALQALEKFFQEAKKG